jgi:ABC-2 type transport system permease protein
MLGRIWALIVKELIQLSRDRLFAPFIIFGPMLELSLVAWATSAPITNLPTALVDMDQTELSRQAIVALSNTKTFAFNFYLNDETAVPPLIESGQVAAAFIIPNGYARDVISPERAPAQIGLFLDGADPLAARQALSSAQGVIETLNLRQLKAWNAGVDVDESLVEPRVRVRYNEELRKSAFTVPAEAGMMLFAVALVIASIGIAREKERGTLEQIVVTPVRYAELILAKAIPAVTLAFISFNLMLQVSIHFFKLPMRGSWPLLLAVSLYFLMIELGIGLMASAYAGTQMQASMLVFAWVMVEFLFTGYGVPVENMPLLLQKLANIFPLYHYMFIFRSILLKGVGISAFWEHLVIAFFLGLAINVLTLFFLTRQKWE